MAGSVPNGIVVCLIMITKTHPFLSQREQLLLFICFMLSNIIFCREARLSGLIGMKTGELVVSVCKRFLESAQGMSPVYNQ